MQWVFKETTPAIYWTQVLTWYSSVDKCLPILKIGARICAPALPKSNILMSSGKILLVQIAGGKLSSFPVRLVKNLDFSLSSLICKMMEMVVDGPIKKKWPQTPQTPTNAHLKFLKESHGVDKIVSEETTRLAQLLYFGCRIRPFCRDFRHKFHVGRRKCLWNGSHLAQLVHGFQGPSIEYLPYKTSESPYVRRCSCHSAASCSLWRYVLFQFVGAWGHSGTLGAGTLKPENLPFQTYRNKCGFTREIGDCVSGERTLILGLSNGHSLIMSRYNINWVQN